jgi:hypothetical protein
VEAQESAAALRFSKAVSWLSFSCWVAEARRQNGPSSSQWAVPFYVINSHTGGNGSFGERQQFQKAFSESHSTHAPFSGTANASEGLGVA